MDETHEGCRTSKEGEESGGEERESGVGVTASRVDVESKEEVEKVEKAVLEGLYRYLEGGSARDRSLVISRQLGRTATGYSHLVGAVSTTGLLMEDLTGKFAAMRAEYLSCVCGCVPGRRRGGRLLRTKRLRKKAGLLPPLGRVRRTTVYFDDLIGGD